MRDETYVDVSDSDVLLQATLFVGAIQRVWPDEAAFHTTMLQYGPLERCFLMHNPEGASKVISLQQRSTPSHCKWPVEWWPVLVHIAHTHSTFCYVHASMVLSQVQLEVLSTPYTWRARAHASHVVLRPECSW